MAEWVTGQEYGLIAVIAATATATPSLPADRSPGFAERGGSSRIYRIAVPAIWPEDQNARYATPVAVGSSGSAEMSQSAAAVVASRVAAAHGGNERVSRNPDVLSRRGQACFPPAISAVNLLSCTRQMSHATL